MIRKKCDDTRVDYTMEDIENITDEIYSAVEAIEEVNTNREKDVRSNRNISMEMAVNGRKQMKEEKNQTRHINNVLRDLIKILLIRELIDRPGRPNHIPPRPPFPGPIPPFRPHPGRPFENRNDDIFE